MRSRATAGAQPDRDERNVADPIVLSASAAVLKALAPGTKASEDMAPVARH
jgi:hypothetical protein